MSDSRLSKVQSTDKIKRFPHKILPDSINSKENMWTELGKVRVN